MNVEVFSLCDAATSEGGKLNILGIFDTIWAFNVPAVHPLCAIALRIRFENIENGEHKIVVNFVDLDGKHIIPSANGTINITLADQQRSAFADLVLNIQMLKIEKYGEYAIDLAVDGRKEATIPLFVRQRPL